MSGYLQIKTHTQVITLKPAQAAVCMEVRVREREREGMGIKREKGESERDEINRKKTSKKGSRQTNTNYIEGLGRSTESGAPNLQFKYIREG